MTPNNESMIIVWRGKLIEIDPLQAWFLRPEWQDDETQAEEDLRNSDYEEFDNIDDFIDSL